MDLRFTNEMFHSLQAAFEREGLQIAQRSASGRISVFKRPKNFDPNISPNKVLANFSPQEGMLLGLNIFILSAAADPEFALKQFGIKRIESERASHIVPIDAVPPRCLTCSYLDGEVYKLCSGCQASEAAGRG